MGPMLVVQGVVAGPNAFGAGWMAVLAFVCGGFLIFGLGIVALCAKRKT